MHDLERRYRLSRLEKGKNMIRLTRLNGEEFVVNCNQIERVESIPESNITLVSGKHYVVKEDVEEIINRVIEYNARIYACAQKMKV